MSEKIKYWYFTANVSRVSKQTRQVFETKTFSRAEWSTKEFFPIFEAVTRITHVLLEREEFFDPNEHFCSVQIINQIEISERDYKYFTDEFGFLCKGGQLI